MDSCWSKIILLLTTFVLLVPGHLAYFLVIDAHAEECFFERVTSGTKMGLTFEVVEGGFLDIDVTITGMMLDFVFLSLIRIGFRPRSQIDSQ